MKAAKWLMAALILLFVSNVTPSQGNSRAVAYAWQETQEAKAKIKTEELPAPAIKHLDDNYKGWTVVQAYRVKVQGKEEFVVDVRKDAQTQTLKFDKDGNLKK